MTFELLIAAVATVAGGVASVVGFGIGSLLTPLYATHMETKLAVAAVSIPHVCGTALRCWRLRGHIDRKLLLSFGLASALGGLGGALLHDLASSRALEVVFGLLLLLAGGSELTGLARRVRLGRVGAWIAGMLSGVFGGLVGNQGGIRSAAMLGFEVPRDAFVGTATAIALLVDFGRMPVYAATQWRELLARWPLIAIGIGGVLAGTLLGTRLLKAIPEKVFRSIVAVIVLLLAGYMLFLKRG